MRLTAFSIALALIMVRAPARLAAPSSSLERTERATLTLQAEPQEQALRCSPQRLYRGDTLNIEMPAPHGGYLAVVNPAGKYFFLTSDTPEASRSEREAGAHPVINATDLININSLQLATTEAKAVDWAKHWRAGKGRAEKIFNRIGWYKLLISHMNFERDNPSYDAMCRVRYINRQRVK